MQDTAIDLKAATGQEGINRLGAAFAELPAGGTLKFITTADPRPLIRNFITAHWGRFNWAPLLEQSGEFVSMIGKREQPGPNSLEEMLSADHRRCDDLFAGAEGAANAGDQESATDLFNQLDLGLERHFRMEEEGFFAELDRRMGFSGGGPVAVMREEHQQMRGMLIRMRSALEQSDLEDYLGASETMLYLMEQHNMKEEQMLYPMADEAYGGEAEELLKQLVLY